MDLFLVEHLVERVNKYWVKAKGRDLHLGKLRLRRSSIHNLSTHTTYVGIICKAHSKVLLSFLAILCNGHFILLIL
jgi:hypothetical protein